MRKYDSLVDYPSGNVSKSNIPPFHRRMNWSIDLVAVGILERTDFRMLKNFATGVHNCRKKWVYSAILYFCIKLISFQISILTREGRRMDRPKYLCKL